MIKIICVDNHYLDPSGNDVSDKIKIGEIYDGEPVVYKSLTYEKLDNSGWQTAVYSDYPGYHIYSCDHSQYFFPLRCFELLAEYREKQIDSIINE